MLYLKPCNGCWGSYKPVTRWIYDAKVAGINTDEVFRLRTVILVKLLTLYDDNWRTQTATVNDDVVKAKVE